MIVLHFLLGVIVGGIGGWIGVFIHTVVEKKSLRWSWLLCKFTKLSEEERIELSEFYEYPNVRYVQVVEYG